MFSYFSLFLEEESKTELPLSFLWLSGQFLSWIFTSNQVISLANCTLVKLDNFGGRFFFSDESSFFVVYYYFFSKTNVLTPFSGLFYPSLCVRPVIIEKFGRNCREEFSGKIFFSFFFFQTFLEKSYAQFSAFLYRRLLVKRKHLW